MKKFLIALLFPGFASWIGPALAVGNTLLGGNTPGGGGASGGQAQYVPTNLAGADQGWQDAFYGQQNIANQTNQYASPFYQQSLNQGTGIGYQQYLSDSNQAGAAYSQAGNLAQQQVGGYQQAAQLAQGQQQGLYAAGQQAYQTSLDPQNALYNRTQQQLQDQVRAGQAARGLGNSAVGAGLEDQANSNFNIDWQNQQLARQTQGINAYSQASGAGAQQGQLYGSDQAAALGASSAAGGYYAQGANIPMQAQQYAAAQPGQIANQYAQSQLGLQQQYGNVATQALPYMTNGQGAQQGNYTNATAQNAATVQGLTQFGQAIAPQVQGWFGSGQGQMGPSQNPSGGLGPSFDQYITS